MFSINRYIAIAMFILHIVNVNALGQANSDLDMLVSDTKNDLMTVVGGGLAGAVLGLSTLSFVEEPKDHTKNIIVGASIGIIFGVGYVAFSQATKTQEMMYGAEEMTVSTRINSKEFHTYARSSWHNKEQSGYTSQHSTPYQFNYTLKF